MVVGLLLVLLGCPPEGPGAETDGGAGGGIAAGGGNAFGGGSAAGGGGAQDGGAPDAGPADAGLDEAWARAFERIVAYAESLPTSSGPSFRAALLAYARAQPEVSTAVETDDGVSAILNNGIPIMFLDNRGPAADPDAGLETFATPPDPRKTDVPTGTRARVINAMGPAFIDESRIVRPLLESKGYSVVAGDGTVEGLRRVSGDSVFYFSTHGGQADVWLLDANGQVVRTPDGHPVEILDYALWTTTTYDPADPNRYADELAAGRLGLGWALHHLDATGKRVNEQHYWVTSRFVTHYWSFAQDALVWLSACSTESAVAANLRAATLAPSRADAGAGLYVGWTNPVTSDAATLGAKFVIDRLLGANKAAPKENPPQRAFDYRAVWTDLRSRGLHLHPDPTRDGGVTELTFTASPSSQFGLLAPSLEHVLVDEYNDRAILLGLFGMPPASERAVLIGGLEARVQTWAEDRIVVDLPRTGMGSSGDVLVSVRGHDSNIRRITEWTLHFTYSSADSAVATLRFDGPVTVRLRGDVGEYRERPAQMPVTPLRYAIATRDSQAFITASGSHPQGNCVMTWSGAAQVSPAFYTTGSPLLASIARVDVSAKTLTLGLQIGDTPPLPWTSTITCPTTTTTGPVAPGFGLLQGLVQFASPLDDGRQMPPLLAYTFSLDPTWGIGAGVYDQPTSTLLIHLAWDASPATSPPDPMAPR